MTTRAPQIPGLQLLSALASASRTVVAQAFQPVRQRPTTARTRARKPETMKEHPGGVERRWGVWALARFCAPWVSNAGEKEKNALPKEHKTLSLRGFGAPNSGWLAAKAFFSFSPGSWLRCKKRAKAHTPRRAAVPGFPIDVPPGGNYRKVFFLVAALPALAALATAAGRGSPWPLHTIDNSSRGADGVRLADVNGDGLLDITTGWEEGGVVRVYLNPGPKRAKERWPAVTVGKVRSVEDAVFADLDADGATDVVSCCEGRTRTVFVHWAPKNGLDPSAWRTEAFPALQGKAMWMFALPLQVDGKNGIDLVVGAKGGGARIGWLEAPANPRNLADWKWHPLYDAGWIMSLIALDLDGDGDLDILASDRKGRNRGCLWLENPGPGETSDWKEHRIGKGDREVMFITTCDLDRDGLGDVLAATRGYELVLYRRTAAKPPAWEAHVIKLPPNTGTGKAVAVADINLDGKHDIVFTCEHARGKSGVVWLSYRRSPLEPDWEPHEISGPKGTKYDLVVPIDLDADGDLDVLTCEEAENLGVIWYENPTR